MTCVAVKLTSFPLARARLNPIARAWLGAGYSAFGVWAHDVPIEYWPAGAAPPLPDVTADVPGAFPGIRIGLVGSPTSAAAERLKADAAVIGQMASVESDLDAMTAELVDRQDELLAIYDLIRSTRSQLDLHLTLGTLARQMARLLKASLGFAMVSTDNGQHLLAATPPGWIDGPTIRSVLEGVQGGTPRDMLLPAPMFAGRPSGSARHVLALRVSVGKAFAGIGVGRESGPFAAPAVKLALAIAEQAGAYIENALFYHESVQQVRLESEMQMAADVQRHLLPRRWPAVAGLDLHASARPASVVGGDFYDVLSLGPDRTFVALGDVTGKGAAAALVMSMTRAAIRSAVRNGDRADPGDVLRHTITSLHDDLDELGMYATTFLASFDARTREVAYVSAGHSPVIHRPAAGPSVLWTPEEPPLGMIDRVATGTRTIALAPGDVLVIATDGFNEARDPDAALFGTDRLLATVDRVHGGTAADIGKHLSEAVRAFQRGREQDDDQTLLVMKGTRAE
jgi:sigma-B regulation protein RsbU (phosphoserine phosphatase)